MGRQQQKKREAKRAKRKLAQRESTKANNAAKTGEKRGAHLLSEGRSKATRVTLSDFRKSVRGY